jgi:hypothetical protein
MPSSVTMCVTWSPAIMTGRLGENAVLMELLGVELFDKHRDVLLFGAGGRDLDDELASAEDLLHHGARGGGRGGVVAAAGGGAAKVRCAAEAGDHALDGGGRIAEAVDLQRRANEQVDGVEPGDVRAAAVGAHGAVGADGENVGARPDIVLHAGFAAEGVDVFDESRLDGRDERGVRVEHPARGDPGP